jgi:hypothetical protein
MSDTQETTTALHTSPQTFGHIQGCIQKFLYWVSKKINDDDDDDNNNNNNNNNRHSLRSNTKGYGSKTH